ncbi:MAG TPA: prepilin-type N-terminal cleavage/methylation domain-containing protein [Thermoanaerobaculia bacterium]|nr:prepilin-type N-terminal cleavage/methylation domain-containing protein [Thermoanaerobaculia bacterium]
MTTQPTASAGPSRRRAAERGMSLIEVLVAVAIMTAIALGIIPLFVRSIRQNREGANYNDITNVARSALEEMVHHDFNSPDLTIDAGTSKRTRQVFDRGLQRWVDSTSSIPAPSDAKKPHIYERWITVEQFRGGDFHEDGYLDNPLPAGTSPLEVNIKRIRVMVRPLLGPEFAFGRRNNTTLEIIKTT